MYYSLSLGGIKEFFVGQDQYLSHLLFQLALTLMGLPVLCGLIVGKSESIVDHLPIGYVMLFLIAGLRITRSRPGADRSAPVFSLPMSAHLTLNFVLFVTCFVMVVTNSIR